MWMVIAGVMGALGVSAAAVGAHALPRLVGPHVTGDELDRIVELWNRAAVYHLDHALAVGLVAVALAGRSSPWLQLSGSCFAVGIILFCGGSYLQAIPGWLGFSRTLPWGGMLWIVGWLAFAVAGLRSLSPSAAAESPR